MAKLAFITSRYLPMPDANGICVQQIVNQLKNEGHEIIVICSQEEGQLKIEQIDGVRIIRVKNSWFANLLERNKNNSRKKILMISVMIIRRIRLLLSGFIFPNVDPLRSKRIYNIVKSEINGGSIDCIIGVFRPFEGISVAQKIKKEYPEIICGAYYLDVLRGATISKTFPVEIYNKLCDSKEVRIFRKLDFVLMAESSKLIYNLPYFNSVREKINYINFPLFSNKLAEPYLKQDYDCEYYNLVYAGYLDYRYRNPRFIFELIKNIIKSGLKVRLHIYGRNNCLNMINEFCLLYPNNFYYYGEVDRNKAKGALLSADAVLNISNVNKNIVPSKIFEIFSFCKPIISVISNPNDSSLEYLKKYPCSHLVNEYNGELKKETIKLIDFIINSKNIVVNYEDINHLFFSSKPVATTRIINEYLIKKEVKDE